MTIRTPRLEAALAQGKARSDVTDGFHEDGWANALTGFGTPRDRAMATSYLLDFQLTPVELDSLFYGNDIAAKIVEFRPKEEFRRGYELRIDDEGNSSIPDDLQGRARELNLDEKLLEAKTWARLYGGCLVIFGVNDGQEMDQELNEDAIRSLDYIHVVDKRYAIAQEYYSDPLDPKYGWPSLYAVGDPLFGNWQMIHESRCLRFEGVKVDPRRRRQNAGWGLSVLQRPYEAMRDFGTAFQSVGFMLSDASQGVLKLHGLVAAIGANKKNAIQQRLAAIDMSRGVNRAIILDAEKNETFEKIATQFAGVSDMLDRYMDRLAAAAEMPVTILMGKSAGGLKSASGESDFRYFYATVESDQVNQLKPQLQRAYDLIARSEGMALNDEGHVDGLDFYFNPLWSPTDEEAAALQYQVAQSDAIYMNAGVLHPSEVALSRFGGGKFSMSTEIDTDSRKKELEADIKAAMEPPKPPVAPPPTPGQPNVTQPAAPPGDVGNQQPDQAKADPPGADTKTTY